ncbi:MAG: M81 family metallopeptidase [Verrucomicrobia bacterium]|nr:M81 family metallopeptidase [Verrucomicrobiota bacterium]
MKKRVLIAGLFHETNTFVEQPTCLSDFQIRRGDELLGGAGDSSPLGGALEAAAGFGWTALPTVDFRAAPGGVVEDHVIEAFWSEFRRFTEPQLAKGVDAVYLVLHGAMVSESIPDVEGEILERIRRFPALARVPVFGVFDLHANFTQRMADHSNGLVAYRENPHTDAREAAQRAAGLLEKCFATGRIPWTYWQHPPIIWPPTGTGTAHDPMRALQALARHLEAECEEVWTVNVAAGFSFADIPDTGVSLSIVTTGAESDARARLDQLARFAWKNRAQGNVLAPAVEAVMPEILSASGLTVLAEPSDNIGAGAPGDGTGLLRALAKYGVRNAAIAINDLESVRKLWEAPLGTRMTLSVGGKGSTLDAGPLELGVQLVSRSDGKFQLEDKHSHLASMAGDSFDMGPCTVVRHEGILILLTSRRTPPFDLGQWRSQGIQPEKLSVIAVKAAVAHRRAYDPIAARMFWVDTPGPCRSNLWALPYRRVRRPVYPLDQVTA